jgi:dihydrofolate reductase
MARPEIVLIAAIAKQNRVIGKDGKLPWYIPEDLKRFKRLTMGFPVIMGRKTFDSIIARNKRPLPGRPNLVLTKTREYPEFPEVSTFSSLNDAVQAAEGAETVFIIGGASLYQEAFESADRLELTLVNGEYEGDAWFPEYETCVAEKFELIEEICQRGYSFVTYRRI